MRRGATAGGESALHSLQGVREDEAIGAVVLQGRAGLQLAPQKANQSDQGDEEKRPT